MRHPEYPANKNSVIQLCNRPGGQTIYTIMQTMNWRYAYARDIIRHLIGDKILKISENEVISHRGRNIKVYELSGLIRAFKPPEHCDLMKFFYGMEN